MKTLKLYSIARIAAAAALFLLAGCDKNKDPDAEPLLRISPASERIAFGAEPTESYTFTVTTNQSEWAVRSDQDWCEVAPDAEAGTFTVTALPNDLPTAPPAATITVSAGKAAPITIAATQAEARYEVYVMGEVQSFDGDFHLCYWKEGEMHPLPVPDGAVSGDSYVMTVDNGSVYIFGNYDDGENEISGYWKEGGDFVPLLGVDPRRDRVDAFTVANGSIYYGGRTYLGDNYAACYWKEGVRTVVSPEIDGEVEYMTVSEGRLHMAGTYWGGVRTYPCTWTDGQFSALERPEDGHYSRVYGMALSRGRLCVLGEERESENDLPLWIDGAKHWFEFPAGARFPKSVALCSTPDDSFLILGWFVRADGARCGSLWDEQGRRSELVDAYDVGGIAVAGGSVYIAGRSSESTPCYWKDGTRTDLPVPADTEFAYVGNICVVKK